MAEIVWPRYLKTDRARKSQILDEFVAAIGYYRKHANRLLKYVPRPKGRKKTGRRKIYQGEVVRVLEQIWEIRGRICSRRLKPFLPEIVEALEWHQELRLSEETKALLLGMSRATIDRCLKGARFEKRRERSTTKPGTLLKNSITVRKWNEWDDARREPSTSSLIRPSRCVRG